MKKMVSLLLIVLFLTAACSNKTAATSSTSGTSGTTDVAEADATSDTGATADEDEGTDEDDSAETDDSDADASEESSDTPKLGANGFPDPAYYWEGEDFFDIQAFADDCGANKTGFGWNTERTEKRFFYAKFDEWEVQCLLQQTICLIESGNRAHTIVVSGPNMANTDTLVYLDAERTYSIYSFYVDRYTKTVFSMLAHPNECPLTGSGIKHVENNGNRYTEHDDH